MRVLPRVRAKQSRCLEFLNKAGQAPCLPPGSRQGAQGGDYIIVLYSILEEFSPFSLFCDSVLLSAFGAYDYLRLPAARPEHLKIKTPA
jgi:hypothetical protein